MAFLINFPTRIFKQGILLQYTFCELKTRFKDLRLFRKIKKKKRFDE